MTLCVTMDSGWYGGGEDWPAENGYDEGAGPAGYGYQAAYAQSLGVPGYAMTEQVDQTWQYPQPAPGQTLSGNAAPRSVVCFWGCCYHAFHIRTLNNVAASALFLKKSRCFVHSCDEQAVQPGRFPIRSLPANLCAVLLPRRRLHHTLSSFPGQFHSREQSPHQPARVPVL